MAELDELLAEALRDLAAEAPGLPSLSPRARRRIRAARAGAILASVVVVAGVSAGLVLGALALSRATRSRPPNSPKPHPAWAINTVGGNDALAVGSSMLYVAAGEFPDATLSAFSRTTGQLIRRIGVPAQPAALRVGPGGSVWLTFYPGQNGGGTGLWLLSPDLAQRSSLSPRAATSIGLSDLLPVGAADALVAGNGLADLHMPVPGHPGRAAFHQVSALPADHGYAAGIFARLAGHVAVLQENKTQGYRIVLAGQPGQVFDPGAGVNINSMGGGGSGLWITTGFQPTGPSTGAVIRLNDRLQVVTPRSVSKNPALAFPAQVWATGDTVVATTDSSSQPLVCFRFQNGQAGPVTGIPARLPPGDVAVAGDAVYAADASGVIAYRLPAACR